jgi:hypothetical protein
MQPGEGHREGPARGNKRVTERNSFSPPTLSKLGVTKNNPPNGVLTFQTKTTWRAPVPPCGHIWPHDQYSHSGAIGRGELLGEFHVLIALLEEDVARLRTRWCALPPDHPERTRLLQRIEISARGLLRIAGPRDPHHRPGG